MFDQLAVVVIIDNIVGKAQLVDSYEEAMEVGEEFIHDLYQEDGVDSSGDPNTIKELQKDLEEGRYYTLYRKEDQSPIVVQIIGFE